MSCADDGPVVGDDGVFEVDRVIDIMWLDEIEGGDGCPLYRVRWKGFPPIEDTWEPIDNFTVETRRTVRKFVRHYKKLQRSDHHVSGQGDPRHVNVLSREITSIQSMRCDTHRQPPLWFYLVVWRGEKPEDATWESEVYLQHASDLIQLFRDRHLSPPVPGTVRRGGSGGASTATLPPGAPAAPPSGTAKLLLDAPAPRKQKEKITFLNDLVDDSIRYEQEPRAKAPRKPLTSSACDPPEPSLSLENFHKELGESLKSIDNSLPYAVKSQLPKSLASTQQLKANKIYKSSNFSRHPNASNEANRSSFGKPTSVENSFKASLTPKSSTSLEVDKTKRIEGGKLDGTPIVEPSTLCRKGDSVLDSSEDQYSEISVSAPPKYRRVVVTSDSCGSDTLQDDDLNSYKSKFIKNLKLEEKKRRKQLMASRKVKPLRQKRTVRRKEASDLPFSEKNRPFAFPELSENSSIVDEKCGNNRKSSTAYNDELPRNKNLAHHPRNVHILQKFENIFGYDTDSEDLTLSSASFCSSGGSSVRKENSEPNNSKLEASSSKGNLEHDSGPTSCEEPAWNLLAGLPDYAAARTTERYRSAPLVECLTEEDFLVAVASGDYKVALQYLQCPNKLLPQLPYASMMMDAMRSGRRDVAQLLAAAALGAVTGGSEWQALWVPAVEQAAKTGDLNMLLMLTQLVRSPALFNGHSPTKGQSSLPAQSDRGEVTRALRWLTLKNAEDCEQKHVITALYRNIIF